MGHDLMKTESCQRRSRQVNTCLLSCSMTNRRYSHPKMMQAALIIGFFMDKTMTRISSCKIPPVNRMWMWGFTAKMHIWIPVGLVCSLQSHIHTPAIQMACKPAQEIYSKHETKGLRKPQINTGAYKARDWAKYWRTNCITKTWETP